jgi:PIN domain nuclease of toxin-antitoxin system
MKLLLDSHLLLWAAAETLPEKAEVYVTDEANELYFSAASIWEIVIKHNLFRDEFVCDPAALYQGLLNNGYQEISVTGKHALQVDVLPNIHKDPFDRIMIAQSISEGLTLLTADETVARYPGSIVCVA